MSCLALISSVGVTILASLAIGAFGDDCPEKYKQFSVNHTYCLPANKTCDIKGSGVTEKQKTIILDEHNKFRSSVAVGKLDVISLPTASDMMQLEWDAELAEVAQKLTDQCVFQHDCNKCREIPNFSVGQNLYVSPLMRGSELEEANWSAAVKAWYGEVSLFKQEYMKPFVFAMNYGHFSQVSWGSTWKVGCGYTLFADGKDTLTGLYACNYGPAGNMMGGTMYTTGVPCSNCPKNSCCGDTFKNPDGYPGLCRYKLKKNNNCQDGPLSTK